MRDWTLSLCIVFIYLFLLPRLVRLLSLLRTRILDSLTLIFVSVSNIIYEYKSKTKNGDTAEVTLTKLVSQTITAVVNSILTG